jgi:hypothetical protein
LGACTCVYVYVHTHVCGCGRSLPNHQLLWHGSRTANFGGILSQGLRIAPPEAPVQGYMFGKGLYTAGACARALGAGGMGGRAGSAADIVRPCARGRHGEQECQLLLCQPAAPDGTP